MADRKVELMTKKQAAVIVEEASYIPGGFIENINKEIKRQIVEEGKTSFTIDRSMIGTKFQWKNLKFQLSDAGWSVNDDDAFYTIS